MNMIDLTERQHEVVGIMRETGHVIYCSHRGPYILNTNIHKATFRSLVKRGVVVRTKNEHYSGLVYELAPEYKQEVEGQP